MSVRAKRRKGQPEWQPRRHATWVRKKCDACGRPCIVAEEEESSGRLRGALLGADRAPRGGLVRRKDGYVVRDAKFAIADRPRYDFHDCPVRNAAKRIPADLGRRTSEC